MAQDFLEIHKEGLQHIGFWTEQHYEVVKKSIEQRYTTDVIRNYCITQIELGKDKVLIKWVKRFQPLNDEELSENYGR